MIRNKRLRRKYRIRKKIHGTQAKPRMTVYRSLRSLYAQLIDDDKGVTLLSLSENGHKNIEAAKSLGKQLAEKAKSMKIRHVVMDRNGYRYHGVIKALAESARHHGLPF